MASAASSTRSMSCARTNTTALPSATTKSPGETGMSPTVIGTFGADFDDASPRRARGVIAREHREVVRAGLVHVARGTVDDDAGDALQARAERQHAAPSRRVDAGALLDDDDVARLRCLDGGGAEVTRGRRLPASSSRSSLTVTTRPGDPPIRGQAVNPGGRAGQAELVQRVGHRARIQPGEPRQHVIHRSRTTYNAEHAEIAEKF